MQVKTVFCASLSFFLFCFVLLSDVHAGRQQTRIIEASAHNPLSKLQNDMEIVDRKQIDIYEGQTYVGHSVEIISANPKDGNEERWKYSDGLIRGEDDRVEAVWVEVRAGTKNLLGDAVWVRAQLIVTVEERDEGT